MNTISDAMKWRYAVNKFSDKKLSDAELSTLLETTLLSPSSFGLQTWKIVVVSNPEIRLKLMEAGYGQEKIAHSSHLVVFAAKKNIDNALVDAYMNRVSEIRGMSADQLQGYADRIKGTIARGTPEQNMAWATKQAYIAFGVMIAAAASQGIDMAPMEGFDPVKFDEILGLDKMGLESKVIGSLGFRASDDPNSHFKKVRMPMEETIVEIK